MVKNESENGGSVCKECGAPLEQGTKFCVSCGTPIETAQSTEDAAAEVEAEVQTDIPKKTEDTAVDAAQDKAEERDEPVFEQTEIESEPLFAAPPAPPVYQAESFAPASDMPFPEAPSAPEAAGYRQKPKTTGVFVGGVLGFLVMLVLLIGVVIAGVFNGKFLVQRNIDFMFMSLMMYGSMAFAAVLTSRAKGPDISIGAVMTFAAFITASITGSWIIGLVLAVLICAAIGAVNGLFIVYLRAPALLMTLVMSVLLRGIVHLISSGREVMVGREIRMLYELRAGNLPIIPLAVFGGVFVLAFLVVILTGLGKPLSKREAPDNKRVSYFVAYLLSSVIACLVGVLYMSRLGIASPVMGNNFEIFAVFIFAVITSSRFLDNRVLPVIYSIIATVLYVVMINIINIYGLAPSIVTIAAAVITLGFIVISYAARKDSFKGLVQRL